MKRFFAAPLLALSLLLALTLLISPQARAAINLSDGIYTIDYVITKAENESVSMANDYFEKPATLTIKNGEVNAQIQMNHSKWITVFKTPDNDSFVDAKVVSSDSDAETRVVQFKVDDLSKPLISKIHVTVESIDYDHDYTIRFIFDEKSIKSVNSATSNQAMDTAPAKASEPVKGKASVTSTGTNLVQTYDATVSAADKADDSIAGTAAVKQSIENPQTGDTAPIVWLAILLLISSVFMVYRI